MNIKEHEIIMKRYDKKSYDDIISSYNKIAMLTLCLTEGYEDLGYSLDLIKSLKFDIDHIEDDLISISKACSFLSNYIKNNDIKNDENFDSIKITFQFMLNNINKLCDFDKIECKKETSFFLIKNTLKRLKHFCENEDKI